MIGRIRGRLLVKQPPHIMIDVGGIGYELEAPFSTIYELPAVGETVDLYTHLSIREDAHVLFGFHSELGRNLFRTLIKVSGIGPKIGLAVLSTFSVDEFVFCVETKDANQLSKVPGIGKKTAERILIEVNDKLANFHSAGSGSLTLVSGKETPMRGAHLAVSDAVNALVALGYKMPDAQRMIKNVQTDEMDTEQMIRLALQQAAKAG